MSSTDLSEMNKTIKYRCQFIIESDKADNNFELIQREASHIFLDFVKNGDYGKGIEFFAFIINAEEVVNFGRHLDIVHSKNALLITNVNKQIFEEVDQNQKVKLLINAALFLTRYLATSVPLPKDYQADKLNIDFEKYLRLHSFLLTEIEIENIFIKHINTTRFNFVRTYGYGVDKKRLLIDLNDIEDYINNNIAGKTFGKSINMIDFGFELFDFKTDSDGFFKQTENYKRIGTKYKNYLVVKQFDSSQLLNLNQLDQFQLLKSKILEGINDIDDLKKKPKDFKKDEFYTIIENILTSYSEQKIST